ncbi:unnamed protein product [Albugo candida]|uniref:Uncharacterized protein n=1 Tax=Albugo candida TaxID=65357 RepID=A0A024GU00_9STRA|nr:unnamed protein product [Albugo candida]|eukprot:CCI50417.1 unnamed protein product [Albugo candida]
MRQLERLAVSFGILSSLSNGFFETMETHVIAKIFGCRELYSSQHERKGAVSGLVDTPQCSIPTGAKCGDHSKHTCCQESTSYCQPWHSNAYSVPKCAPRKKSTLITTGMTFKSYAESIHECCQKCSETPQCTVDICQSK